MAPKVLDALKAGPMSRTQISTGVFQRNYTAKELNRLRDTLVDREQVVVEQTGRSEVWSLP